MKRRYSLETSRLSHFNGVPDHGNKHEWACTAPAHTTQARRANQLADEACIAEMNWQRARGTQLIEQYERELESKLRWADAAHKVGAKLKEYFCRSANLLVVYTPRMHFVSKGYCVLCERAHSAWVHGGLWLRAGGWDVLGDQRFLLKWLRYRPEHDVKLLIKRWELCVVVQWRCSEWMERALVLIIGGQFSGDFSARELKKRFSRDRGGREGVLRDNTGRPALRDCRRCL